MVVDDTCNFDVIAKRLAWGKLVNAGQVPLYNTIKNPSPLGFSITISRLYLKFFLNFLAISRIKFSNCYGLKLLNHSNYEQITRFYVKVGQGFPVLSTGPTIID